MLFALKLFADEFDHVRDLFAILENLPRERSLLGWDAMAVRASHWRMWI